MSTIYTREFASNTDAGDNCIELPAPIRGSVTRLVITPESGSSAVITSATLYDRQDACDGIARSSNPDDQNPHNLEPLVHQIGAALTPSGSDITGFGLNLIYHNQDEQYIHGRANSRLWMSLVMATGGIVHIGYTIEAKTPD